MKQNKVTIDTREALNRLAHPTFFDHLVRQEAFDIVMRDGNPLQKQSAEQALLMWPIEGLKRKAVA
ncbi:MAG TPA: hypothetical protein VGM92_00540 [Candidatus Kapabacteria bacterium]|jgi:hypothetical protein